MKRPVSFVLLASLATAGCAAEGHTPLESEWVVAPVLANASNGHGPRSFRTHASGGEEVPANTSTAQGQAIFQLSPDGTALSYRLIVANIENVTQAHIHLAAEGVNGPVVVWLYPSAPPAQLIPGSSQGTLNSGVITESNLVGMLAGQSLAALVAHIEAGNAYVNVHTQQFPPGEIRGQIR